MYRQIHRTDRFPLEIAVKAHVLHNNFSGASYLLPRVDRCLHRSVQREFDPLPRPETVKKSRLSRKFPELLPVKIRLSSSTDWCFACVMLWSSIRIKRGKGASWYQIANL